MPSDPVMSPVSLSLGDTCIFRCGGTRRRDPSHIFRLASGDAMVLAQDRRLAVGRDHAVGQGEGPEV